jgi:hypothetical protein
VNDIPSEFAVRPSHRFPALPSVLQADRAPSADAILSMPAMQAVTTTLRWQAFALVCLACHVALVREIGIAGFPVILFCLLLVCRHDRLAGMIMYLQLLLYQNVAISIFSAGMTKFDFTMLSGTSFAATLMLASQPLYRRVRHGRAFQGRQLGLSRTATMAALGIAAAAVYSVYGAAVAGPTEAAVGFRNASTMLLALVVGLDAGDRWSYRTIATVLLVSALLGLGLVGLEIADPDWYLSLVNAADFSNVKYLPSELPLYYTSENVVSRMTQLPFNTDLLSSILPGTAYRFGGPNMHSISYGYVLAIAEIALLSLGWVAPVLPLLLLSFLIGVKGAAILFCGSAALFVVWRVTRQIRILWLGGLLLGVVYVGFGIWSGLKSGDFHVIGLIGGLNGFMANPLGHGVGIGGNLSVGSLTMMQWQAFQHDGADVGLESAVGVLLYQMGIGCLALVAAIVVLLRSAPFGGAEGRPRPTDIVFIALCTCLVNGVFQEEAYSPYAAGLLCMLCGVLIANGRRPAALAHAQNA